MSSSVIYHPKENHPWRRYQNKKQSSNGEAKVFPALPLNLFLKDIVDCWDTYQIPPASYESREYIYLCKISPDKQAEWLIGFLKKHWLSSAKGALIFE